MTDRVQYRDPTDTGRGPSPIIWARFPSKDIYCQPDLGLEVFDDFETFGGLVTSTVGQYSGKAGHYTSYEDSGGSILSLATEVGGVIKSLTDATDNDENWIQPGGITTVQCKISTTSGSDYKTYFEARVRPAQIATGNFFVGLAQEGLAAADTITDAGAMADKDWIGFRCLEAGSSLLDVAYKKEGQTVQQLIASAQTLVAATWYKLGFVYDPAEDASKRIKFYIDGAEQTTYITATMLAAATFPLGEELNFLFGHKNSTGAVNSVDLDWYRIGQYHGG